MMYLPLQKNKGYTLLFAVLVSSLVLAIGISILTIAKKEFLIATSARDSSEAFYAADGSMECSLYEDKVSSYKNFAVGTPLNCAFTPVPTVTEVSAYTDIDGDQGTEYKFHVKHGAVSCAVVKVRKITKTIEGTPVVFTDIDSRGYNTGWNDPTHPNNAYPVNTCTIPGAKRVERALHYSY